MNFIFWLDSLLEKIFGFLFPPPAYDQDPKTLPMNQDPAPKTPPDAPQAPQTNEIPEVDTSPISEKLQLLATCIRDYEGKPGDRNYRNNSPGNVRYSSKGYLAKYLPVGRDKDNFAVFKDYETGWLYLLNLILYKIKENPRQTLLQFISNYAPESDGNYPKAYASYLAQRLNVSIITPMSYFL